MVEITDLTPEDKNIILMYLEKHVALTGSVKGKQVYDNFSALASQFKKVLPIDYKNALSSRQLSISDVLADKDRVYQDIKVDLK
jgi:glutamate synthase (NADPH/NADH) large chain